MTRMHPDDIRSLAEQIAALIKGDAPAPVIDAATEARIRSSARVDLASAMARKQQKRRA